MGSIKILSDQVANQIAAGEVVERPFCVVKELVENALDAQATQIEIVVLDGGTELISVSDDGIGMDAHDAHLCFSRHATSKLTSMQDLETIASFGFRGEALPSIASVSRTKLVTRQQASEKAICIELEGIRILDTYELGAPHGTRLEIRELFFNVPARRKFLRSPRSETAHIEQVVRSMALMVPQVGFQLFADGKLLFHSPKAPEHSDLNHPLRLARAIACMGEDVKENLFAIDENIGPLRLSGFVASPLISRKDSRGIKLYVNHRLIEDMRLSQVVRVAFRTLLEVGRFPVCALHIEVDPSLVDVNAHPQKLQVRFAEADKVHSFVIRSLGQFLASTPWLKRGEKPLVMPTNQYESGGLDSDHSSRNDNYRSVSLEQLFKPQAGFTLRDSTPSPEQPTPIAPQMNLGGATRFCDLQVLGQVDNTYLVLSSPTALIVLDQHAAHERVMFEKIQSDLKQGSLASQALLVPLQISLSPIQMAVLETHAQKLAQYGFVVEPFGANQAMIRATPVFLSSQAASRVVNDVLDEQSDFIDKIAAQMSCHGSVRAGQKLSDSEIHALLAQMEEIDYAAHCPHGRPVIKAIPFTQIGKWFHRS